MKFFIIMVLMVIMFTGCAKYDAQYAKAKDTYVAAEEVVKVIPKDPATEETLGIVDWIAETYDEVRSAIRGSDAQ